MSHYLYAYLVRFSKPGDQNIRLGNLDDNGLRAAGMFESLLRESGIWQSADKKHQVQVASVTSSTDYDDEDLKEVVCASLEIGETGIRANIFATDDELNPADEVAYEMQEDDVVFLRAQVVAWLPGDSSRGIVVTHSPSNRRYKGLLKDELVAAAKKNGLTAHLNPLAPFESLEHVLNDGELSKITVRKLVKDTADLSGENPLVPNGDSAIITTTVTNGTRGGFLNKRRITDAIENGVIEIHGEQWEEIKATVAIGTRNYPINVSKGNPPIAGVEITDRVRTGTDGFATAESVRSAALDYVADLRHHV